MQILFVYLLIFIVPMIMLNKYIDSKEFNIDEFDKEKYLNLIDKSKPFVLVAWFLLGAFFSLLIGNSIWDSYIENGQEYYNDNAVTFAIMVIVSGYIYIGFKKRSIVRKINKFDKIKQKKDIEDEIKRKKKEQEIKQKKLLIQQKELEKKELEKKRVIEKKKKDHKKQVFEYFELYNIDKKFYEKIIEFYKKPYFKNELNPFNEVDFLIINSPEFKLLYDLGMATQEDSFPYTLKILNLEYLLEVLNKSLYRKNRKIILPSVELLDELADGFEFEKYIAHLLKENNFNKVKVLPMSNDYGVDVLAEKSGVKYAVQCKYYSQPVGISAVQEVSSGKNHYKAHVAVVATNSHFTDNAINLAKSNGVLLWDREAILKMSTFEPKGKEV